jgi:hypothetical protein
MAKRETIETIDAALARWKPRLKRAVNMIDKLEKKRRRLVAKATVSAALDPVLEQLGALTIRPKTEKSVVFEPDERDYKDELRLCERYWETDQPKAETVAPPADLNTDIPEFLRRGKAAQEAADAVIADAAEEIKAEQADVKKRKAAGRIAKMKAKKAGDLKKMPLTGKAALAAIRGE